MIRENQELNASGAAESECGPPTTFCLVHGSWHGSWCWDFLQPELEKYGHNVVAADLPINEEYATAGDLKDEVCRVIDDEHNTVLVGHSRAGNVIPFVARELEIMHAVYLNPGFDASNNPYFEKGRLRRLPRKYSKGFGENVIDDPENPRLKTFNPERTREFFYHDCPPDMADWAAQRLQPMNRSIEMPPIISDKNPGWPAVRSSFIMSGSDRVINPNYSRYVAKSLGRKIGAAVFELSGGHSPFLSRPQELAKVLQELVIGNSACIKKVDTFAD